MQPIEIPEIIVLRGEEAIEALHGFIDELEGQRGKDLTDKKADALVRLAEGLISSVEAEMRSKASNEEMRLVKKLKKTAMKCVSRSARMFDAYTRFARVMFLPPFPLARESENRITVRTFQRAETPKSTIRIERRKVKRSKSYF